MKGHEKIAFSKYITSVLAFYKQDVSPFVIDVWWAACEPYNLEQVRSAMTAHATNPQNGQFAPKPADMVRALQGTYTDQAMLAWSKVHGAMVHVGAYQDVRFDEGIIHLVIQDLGGWPDFCRTPNKDLSYLQHRFCESYRAYANLAQQINPNPAQQINPNPAQQINPNPAQQGLLQNYPPFLAGDRSSDEFYQRHGLRLPSPIEVGSAKGCQQVAQAGVRHKSLLTDDDPRLASISSLFKQIKHQRASTASGQENINDS